MAEHDLIHEYRAELLRRLHFRSNVDDIVDEVEDHLRSATESLVRLGNDRDTAQRLTLVRFGDPTIVARSFALTSTGGLSMPTRFTQAAGYIAIGTAIIWIVAGGFAVFGQTSLVTEFSEFSYYTWSALILLAATGTFAALVGLLRRSGAVGSWPGWIAIAALAACVFMFSVFAWFWPAGGLLLTVGALIVVLRARAAALPLDPSVWLLVLAFPVGSGLFAGLTVLQVGPVDEYGDYPTAFVAGIVVAAILAAAGLARLGRRLAREKPLDLDTDRMVGA